MESVTQDIETVTANYHIKDENRSNIKTSVEIAAKYSCKFKKTKVLTKMY